MLVMRILAMVNKISYSKFECFSILIDFGALCAIRLRQQWVHSHILQAARPCMEFTEGSEVIPKAQQNCWSLSWQIVYSCNVCEALFCSLVAVCPPPSTLVSLYPHGNSVPHQYGNSDVTLRHPALAIKHFSTNHCVMLFNATMKEASSRHPMVNLHQGEAGVSFCLKPLTSWQE